MADYVCEECGKDFNLIPTAIADEDGEPVQLYLCEACAKNAELDNHIADETKPIVGYKLTRPDCPGWMHVGTTAAEVAAAIKNEIEQCDGLSADEMGQLVIEPYTTTKADIDELPEFQGW